MITGEKIDNISNIINTNYIINTNNIINTNYIINTNWGTPELVDTKVYNDHIELVYKQTATSWIGLEPRPERVYMVIFSCQDGKWHRSEEIEGKIIPATEETYEF